MSSPKDAEIQKICNNALHWLNSSEIMNSNGSVTAWFAPESSAHQFVSAEITGYAVSFFCWIGDIQRALCAARWLVSTAQDRTGAFRCRWYNGSAAERHFQHDGSTRWIFDTGIILKALVDIYQITGLVEFKAPIEAAVQFLLSTRLDNGLFPGRWDIDAKKPADDLNRWSAQSGSYHAKVDRSIVVATQALQRQEWLEGLEQRINTYIHMYQNEEGGFISYPLYGGIHIHPHLYTCESLWALGHMLNMPSWIEAARCGVQWLADASAKYGRCPRTFYNETFNTNGRIDVAAQYLRVLVLFEQPPYLVNAAAYHLLEFIDQDGAFTFGCNADGTQNRHPDAWGTMVAIQSLRWKIDNKNFSALKLI